MRLTVAVCTWNRAELLRRALEHMTRLIVPEDVEWELLVVNNSCTDATDDVIASLAGRLPIQGLREPQPGLSHARNRALRAATGDYLLWTDDDVLVDEGWFRAYREAFARWPAAAVFGGPIRPLFEGSPPLWIERTLPRIGGVFAVRDLGADPVPLGVEGDRLPYGANYAVRMIEQRRFLYHTDLGRRPGGVLLGSEERELLGDMLGAGATGWWVPAARVRHIIPAERQTIRYVRAYCEGYGQYLRWKAGGARSPGRWALLRRAAAAELRYRVGRVIARPERWVEDLILASETWGQLR